MSNQYHAFIFGCYTAAAITAMFALPEMIHGLSHFTAILFGIVIMLAGGLVQETITRRANESQAVRRLIVLRKAYNQNQEDLARNRDELEEAFGASFTEGQFVVERPDGEEVVRGVVGGDAVELPPGPYRLKVIDEDETWAAQLEE